MGGMLDSLLIPSSQPDRIARFVHLHFSRNYVSLQKDDACFLWEALSVAEIFSLRIL